MRYSTSMGWQYSSWCFIKGPKLCNFTRETYGRAKGMYCYNLSIFWMAWWFEKAAWVIQNIKEVVDNSNDIDSDPQLSKYHIDNGFMKYKSKLVISPDSNWRKKTVWRTSLPLMAGQKGVLKTYRKLKKKKKCFCWRWMKKDIKAKVLKCRICQQNKYETISPPGPLQPLPIPKKVWLDISIDFIIDLLMSQFHIIHFSQFLVYFGKILIFYFIFST